MTMQKRNMTGFVWLLLLLPMFISPTTALADEAYPKRPVTMVVPFGAGGGFDVTIRTIAQIMGENLGRTIVIENRLGAGSMIGVNYVAKAEPDGYTLLAITTAGYASVPVIYKNVQYDPLRDFVGIGISAISPFYLSVKPKGSIQSVSDLLKQAKDNPKKLTFASSGVGSGAHTLMEMLMQKAGVQLTHVPYKGIAAALADVVAGNVDVTFADPAAVDMAKNGLVKVIAVSSKTRSPNMPDVPSLAEAGVPGYDVVAWGAVVAPAKTPPEIVRKLQAAFKDAINSDRYKKYLITSGQSPLVLDTTEDMQNFFKAEVDKWGSVLRAANLVGVIH